MLADTWRDLILIRAVILFLHSIGPLCSAYTLTLLRRAVFTPRIPPLTVFQRWCVAEALFFAFFLWYRTYLQREALHPPPRTKEERKRLFDKVRSEIHDPKKFLSGWFRGAELDDIGRDDLKVFLDWAFWEGRAGGDHDEDLEEYTLKVEKMMGRPFKPGKGKAKSLRLTIDPIEMEWRSLLWYAIILLVDTASHVRMLLYGHKYYWTTATSINIFPPRPLAIATATARSPAKTTSYWLRPHTSKTRLPVVYLHGIGVGLHPHVEFLHELDEALNAGSDKKADGRVGVLSVETMQISTRLTHPILTRDEFAKQLTTVLDTHGFKRFVMVSHSYGSVLSTHILTNDALASRVAGTLLVDPVTVLLHMPDVAYNFTIRQPRHANEWQLWYFASKDPGTSHTLGRHFFWSENILWRDRIMHLVKDKGMRMTASLASHDLIVDTAAVGQYLMEAEVPDPVLVTDETSQQPRMELESKHEGGSEGKMEEWKKREWKGKGLEVMWWQGLDHAQVFDEKASRKKLIDVLVEYSRGE